MKINEFIDMLDIANLALESAPQKGFVDLDQVKKSIENTKRYLIEIAPRLDLGEKLAVDFRDDLIAKLKALKSAGGIALVNQAEQSLNTGNLTYEQLKALRQEIDQTLRKVFGGYTLEASSANSLYNCNRQNLEVFK